MSIPESRVNLSDETLRQVLDPLRAVKARTLLGGTAPSEVQRQIDGSYGRLRKDTETLEGYRGKIKAAATKLENAIDVIIGAA